MGFLNGLKHFFTGSCPKCGADADYYSVIEDSGWYHVPRISAGKRVFKAHEARQMKVACKACGFKREKWLTSP